MDPCAFVKILVGGLALKIPIASKPTGAGIHPSSFPCFCEFKLDRFSVQTTLVPLISVNSPDPDVQNMAASFHLDQADVQKLYKKSCFGSRKPCLEVAVYTGRQGSTCGVNLGKLLGRLSVPLELEDAHERLAVFHNGWVSIGKFRSEESKSGPQLHLKVRVEPDPRFMFLFDGEPECSPQVFQIQGNIRQPIFGCKFSCDRNSRSRSIQSESCSWGWLSSFGSNRERDRRERKGWLVTIHDLSGSPVAAASMITPFVPSPGSDRVSRSNPGAWLILRLGHMGEGSWRPWGRLEAWRERGSSEGLGCRFELMAEGGGLAGMNNGILLAESVISAQKGGQFMINMGNGRSGSSSMNSPASSPRSSGDFSFSLWPFPSCRGFVMSATVQGERRCSKPEVQSNGVPLLSGKGRWQQGKDCNCWRDRADSEPSYRRNRDEESCSFITIRAFESPSIVPNDRGNAKLYPLVGFYAQWSTCRKLKRNLEELVRGRCQCHRNGRGELLRTFTLPAYARICSNKNISCNCNIENGTS